MIIDSVKEFMGVPFNRMLVLVLACLGLLLLFNAPIGNNEIERLEKLQDGRNATLAIDFFYSPTCPHCRAQEAFNEKLVQEYSKIRINAHNTELPGELALMQKMAADAGVPSELSNGVPMTFIGNESIIGFDSEEKNGAKIRMAIERNIGNATSGAGQDAGSELELPVFGKIKPAAVSLPVLAVMLGLVDGFNPCAMWVLVYLIGIVLSMEDKKRLWIVVGSFVLSSGILYFLFMTAWLNAFLFIGYYRPVTIVIGLVALGGAILSLRDFAKNPAAALECKVTGAEDKKKTMSEVQRLVSAPITIATLAGIVALAFAVNSVEFVCSAALPAVFTQVLALSNLGFFEYYAYILLYVLFFMLDDLVIFGLAAMAVSTEFGEKYAGYCKLIGALIMLALGVMLLFFPNALR
ncbi:MAG: hypothetical protein WCT52_01750 [Candidatus Micrarchaeia archaeon]